MKRISSYEVRLVEGQPDSNVRDILREKNSVKWSLRNLMLSGAPLTPSGSKLTIIKRWQLELMLFHKSWMSSEGLADMGIDDVKNMVADYSPDYTTVSLQIDFDFATRKVVHREVATATHDAVHNEEELEEAIARELASDDEDGDDEDGEERKALTMASYGPLATVDLDAL